MRNLNYDEIEIGGITTLLKGHIDAALCDELEKTASPFIEDIDCNLLNTKRTGWRLFDKEEFKPVFQKFSDRVIETIISFSEKKPLLVTDVHESYRVTSIYYNAWVAWYSSDSFVRPHVHGQGEMFSPEYSISCYLKVPNDHTELTFVPRDLGRTNNYTIEVKRGDFLIFPSSLMHYTNSCEEGRVILSGNFSVNVERLGNQNEKEIKK